MSDFSRSSLLLLAILTLSAFGVISACSRSVARNAVVELPPARPTQPPAAARPLAPRPNPAELPKVQPELPDDIPATTSTADEARRAADSFAWKTFLALNWPAQTGGEPDLRQQPGQRGDNPTVWESWPEAAQIFRPAGEVPAPWGAPPSASSLPAELRDLPGGARILSQTGKSSGLETLSAQPCFLIDQNGRYVRFETRVNRPVFETILSDRLYRRDTQSAAGPVTFPAGSIRVQAAWKILSPAEVAAGRFHAVEAVLYTPAPGEAAGPGVVERATVGLVGLHIARKTPTSPEWIWATFEHVDNCPTLGEPADRAAYNFFNKATPDAPSNIPPPAPWNPTITEPESRRPQIIRQTEIPIATRSASAAYQAALRAINPASVWQYYELVGTQRRARPDETAQATPNFINTTLEPYLGTADTPGSSCLDCHAKAVTSAQTSADFSFLLQKAR